MPSLHSLSVKLVSVAVLAVGVLSGCDNEQAKKPPTPEMLVYCGITMVNPIKEIARILEPQLGVKIVISQGGSEDLYQSLKVAQKGDLYLPGSASYRKQHLDEGLLGDFAHVGYNQAALLVVKGNPLGLGRDLKQLANPDYKVVIGDPTTGSIGRETKRILDRVGIYDAVRGNVYFLTTDSRNLNQALKNKDADVAVNWRATAFFPENRPQIDAIDLDTQVATPKKLLINLLTFSAMPDKARQFMDFAASEKGQAIFRAYGFLDNTLNADQGR